jgi:hypothetical protein
LRSHKPTRPCSRERERYEHVAVGWKGKLVVWKCLMEKLTFLIDLLTFLKYSDPVGNCFSLLQVLWFNLSGKIDNFNIDKKNL